MIGSSFVPIATPNRHVFDPKIHWFWLINGLVVVTFLVMSKSARAPSCSIHNRLSRADGSGGQRAREKRYKRYRTI